MAKIQNSAEKWDSFWKMSVFQTPGTGRIENFYRTIIYFRAYERLLNGVNLQGKSILELGSGTGNNSLYLAKKHGAALVSLLDFSAQGLAKVAKDQFPCKVQTIQDDLVSHRPPRAYDTVHSTGLVEHFEDEARLAVVQKHAECAKEGGYVMIWVPVRSFAFAFIGRFNILLGIEEIPFTEEEMRGLFTASGLRIVNETHTAFGALFGILGQKTHEN